MLNVKYPIAYWQDFHGNTTACTLDGIEVSAVGPDLRSAIAQIRKFLDWSYRRDPEQPVPDMSELQVDSVRVPLRARHESANGVFPAEDVVDARFIYVWGRRRDRSIACCLPTLNNHFNCRNESRLAAIVTDQVQRLFADATLRDLAISDPGSEFSTELIHIRIPHRSSAPEFQYPLDTLNEVAIPLGQRGSRKQFSPAWQRDREIEQLIAAIGKSGSSILLLGPPGVGKTTVLAQAVRKVRMNAATESDGEPVDGIPSATPRFWLTSAARLIAGMQYLGQWEERCENVIEELSEIGGVLCVESLTDLIVTGGREPESSVAQFLRYFLVSGELRMIAEATDSELETIRRLLPGLDTLFQIVRIETMNPQDSLRVLNAMADHYQKMHQIAVADGVGGTVVRLFRRFLPYDPFPGKCVAFWQKLLQCTADQIATARYTDHSSGQEPHEPGRSITMDATITAFVRETGLPEFLVRDSKLLNSSDVVSHFRQHVIGQPHACQVVSDLVTTFKAGMNDPARPVGVYLFCGPTGVGKTEMAKTVATYLFGGSEDQDRLIRLDMSEYSLPGSAERLLTRPDGQPSDLVENLRQQPFCVVLLDEIEKANHDVFDTLMNVFDEGQLTDRLGRTTRFCSSVVLMTSNLGTAGNEPIGFDRESGAGYEREVRKFFRPEFFNRIDAVVAFGHLTPKVIGQIAENEILQLQKREGLDRRGIRLHCDPAVCQHVARLGYDPKLGARPLQRMLELHVVTPLARWLAEHPAASGGQLNLQMVDGRVVCTRN